MKENKALLSYCCFVVLFVAALFAIPYLAKGSSTYTDKFGLEMPAQGDVGWDDAVRLNHKIFEVVTTPILEGTYVVTGCTPHAGSGLTMYWDAGWIMMGGVSRYLPSGTTTIANNTIVWISAITPYVSGATIDNRSTEYYPPSGVSGFAYAPIAFITTEAGAVARMKDLRHMPKDHSELHERGGLWEIDGDHLGIDFNPSYYTPATTPSEADNIDDLAAHLYGMDQALNSKASTGTTQVWTATQTFNQAIGNIFRSGASPSINVPTSGTSLSAENFGTIVTHNQATSTIYGMPPISGVSVIYVKIIEGAGGTGITIYNVNAEPFMGNGLSGTSYLALPPGCPFEAATIYSVQISGTCKYWYVEPTGSWVAGN